MGTDAETPSPRCGCGHSDPLAVFERETLRAVARTLPPRASGSLSLHPPGLIAALAPEIVERMEAKASGRPGVNVGRIWSFMTSSVYQSGDLPVLATREALQNGVDAIRAAVRARKTRSGEGRFAVSWDPVRRALTWEDNGVGMDAETILTKFLSLGDSGKRDAAGSDEAAGGFGVAKAVILGTSTTFRWEMHTRDNLAVSEGADADVKVYDAPFLQGTRITIFDVDPAFNRVWDHAQGEHVGLVERLQELLGANDLPGITLSLNGEEVGPLFSRRGGSKVRLPASWGPGTTAAAKAYRRGPGDRRGAYYVRLGGLFQFKYPSQRNNLKADVVVDLTSSMRPGSRSYPFNAGRDALQDDARWAFRRLVDEVERESESVGNDHEDQVFEPEGDAEVDEATDDVADLLADALDDPDVRAALSDASGGLADFYAHQDARRVQAPPATSGALPGSPVHRGPGRSPVDRANGTLGGGRPTSRGAARKSPFGSFGGLRVSRKNYDAARARRFRNAAGRWFPHLAAWDAVLRMVVTEARIHVPFKPGFVLDDEVIGLTTSTGSGTGMVYLNPDRFAQVVKAHRERPLAIAAFLHGVAVHELTHLDGRMGQGHDEGYVVAREDLGHATGHLLPALALIVQRLLKLPVKPTADARRIATLERQLARARERQKKDRRASAEVARLQGELEAVRAELAEAQAESAAARATCGDRCAACGGADPASRIVDVAVQRMIATPPGGTEPGYVVAFARRHRAALVEIVRARLGDQP